MTNKFIITACAFLLASCGDPSCKIDQLKIGMAKEEVLKLCGKPDHINYSGPYGGKIHEQWVYSYMFPFIGGNYLYIEDDKFNSMQWTE